MNGNEQDDDGIGGSAQLSVNIKTRKVSHRDAKIVFIFIDRDGVNGDECVRADTRRR